MELKIDKSSDNPIYQQIVQAIGEQIRAGALRAGDKLPTVRELSASTGISKGTIKHAYDELDKLGAIQMTQGRGTFVLGRKEPETISKKTRAMQAIDRLLDELEELSFTTRDIEIYLGLKLREREDRYEKVRIALVDCNPESLWAMAEQIYQIPNVDVIQYRLNDVIQAPHRLDDTYDLILTTTTHYEVLVEQISSLREMVQKVVMTATQPTVIQLAELPSGSKVGIWCASQKFASIVQKGCKDFGNIEGAPILLLEGEGDSRFAELLPTLEAIIVAPNYLSITTGENLSLLKKFQNQGGRVIVYDYQIDKGSFLHLEDAVKALWMGKRL